MGSQLPRPGETSRDGYRASSLLWVDSICISCEEKWKKQPLPQRSYLWTGACLVCLFGTAYTTSRYRPQNTISDLYRQTDLNQTRVNFPTSIERALAPISWWQLVDESVTLTKTAQKGPRHSELEIN